MDEFEARKIIQNLIFLCENTSNLTSLLSTLLSKGALSLDQVYTINEGFDTTLEKHRELYTILASRRRSSSESTSNELNLFETLCWALRQTGNEAIEEKLKTTECSDDQAATKQPMNRTNRRRLILNCEYLSENASNVSVLLTHLEASFSITRQERQTAMSLPCEHDRMIYICFTLTTKDDTAYGHFKNALESTLNQELARRLEATVVEIKSEEDYEAEQRLVETSERYYIDKKIFQLVKKSRDVWFSMTEPNKRFTGREAEIEALNKSIFSQSSEAMRGMSKVTVLLGFGGVGKTELARKYAYTKRADSSVVWINAETHETMADSFRRLALTRLNIKINTQNIKDVVAGVYEYFGNQKCLFIFDNAESNAQEWNDGIAQFLPKLEPNVRRPDLLVTSRNRRWESTTISWELLELKPLKEDESEAYIRAFLDQAVNSPRAVTRLSNTLKGLPLALEQAVSYINAENKYSGFHEAEFGIDDYVAKFEAAFKELMSFNPSGNAVPDPLYRVVFVTWQTSVKGVERDTLFGKHALDVLNIAAYFNSENIPIAFFKHVDESEDVCRLTYTMELLEKYSLVESKQGKLRIHSLVQQVTRESIQRDSNLKKEVLSKALQILNKFLPSTAAEILTNKITLSHSTSAWEHAQKYPELIRSNFDDLCTTLSHLNFCGSSTKAQALTKIAMEHARNTEGLSDHQRLELMRKISLMEFTTNSRTGNTSAILENVKDMIELTPELNDPTRERTADAALSYEFYNELRRPGANRSPAELRQLAVQFFQKLAALGPVPGSSDSVPPEFLGSASDFGKMMTAVASMVEGGQNNHAHYIEEIVQTLKESVGLDNDLGSAFQRSLADILHSNGSREEALRLFEEIAETDKRRAAAERQPYTQNLPNMVTLPLQLSHAAALNDAGRLDEALELLREIHQQQLEILGSVAEDTLDSQVQIGLTLSRLGQYEEARELLQNTYDVALFELGLDSKVVITAGLALAHALRSLKKYTEALDHLQAAYDYLVMHHGEQHQQTQELAGALAAVRAEHLEFEKTNPKGHGI